MRITAGGGSRVEAYLNRWSWPPWVDRTVAIGRVLYGDVDRVNLFSQAAGMAYVSLGSIVPTLAAMFAVVHLFLPLTDTTAPWFGSLELFILRNLAPQTGAQIVMGLAQFIQRLDVAKIGITGFVSLLVIIVLLLRNVELAFNQIWQVERSRTLWGRFLFFWTVLTLGVLALSLVVGFLAKYELPGLSQWLGGDEFTRAPRLVEAIVGTLATYAFFALLYKIGPNCAVRWRAAAYGAAAATAALRLANLGYGIYVSNNHSYQNVYGALAVVPLTLLWLYVGWIVILFGAVVTRRLQVGAEESLVEQDLIDAQALVPVLGEKNPWQPARTLVPLLCTIAVYERFASASGRGATPSELAHALTLPTAWVREGLGAARQAGLVTATVESGAPRTGPDGSTPEPAYLPALPAEAVTLRGAAERLFGPTLRWLHGLTARGRTSPARLVDSLQAELAEHPAGDVTLATVLAHLAPGLGASGAPSPA
jgi:membrane protein